MVLKTSPPIPTPNDPDYTIAEAVKWSNIDKMLVLRGGKLIGSNWVAVESSAKLIGTFAACEGHPVYIRDCDFARTVFRDSDFENCQVYPFFQCGALKGIPLQDGAVTVERLHYDERYLYGSNDLAYRVSTIKYTALSIAQTEINKHLAPHRERLQGCAQHSSASLDELNDLLESDLKAVNDEEQRCKGVLQQLQLEITSLQCTVEGMESSDVTEEKQQLQALLDNQRKVEELLQALPGRATELNELLESIAYVKDLVNYFRALAIFWTSRAFLEATARMMCAYDHEAVLAFNKTGLPNTCEPKFDVTHMLKAILHEWDQHGVPVQGPRLAAAYRGIDAVGDGLCRNLLEQKTSPPIYDAQLVNIIRALIEGGSVEAVKKLGFDAATAMFERNVMDPEHYNIHEDVPPCYHAQDSVLASVVAATDGAGLDRTTTLTRQNTTAGLVNVGGGGPSAA